MIDYCKFPHICNNTEIAEGVIIEGNVYVKEGVVIAKGCKLRSDEFKLVLESNVRIGDSVIVQNELQRDLRINEKTEIHSGAKIFNSIGRSCTIGENVEIRAEVGDNCVIKAGSIVTSPVPPGSVFDGGEVRGAIHSEIS